MTNSQRNIVAAALACTLVSAVPAAAQTADDLIKRLDRLEQENRDLRHEIDLLKLRSAAQMPQTASQTAALPSRAPDRSDAPTQAEAPEPAVTLNSAYTYAMLDPTAAGKTKPLLLLAAKRDGSLPPRGLTIGGSVIAMGDYQSSNFADDFGYLMRHPGANHVGKTVSELVLHAAALQFTANITPWISTYAEVLYDPQQSFGAGSVTALTRNQLQLRRGYVLFGDLAKSPVYAMIGKIDSPFGQTDTVNPFTLSTDWHSFSGLSYGALLGYSDKGLNIAVEAVQGGAEFRGLNTPVEGTNTPSKISNYVVDANYTVPLGAVGRSLLVGASYERGSSFCQAYPVTHFGTCEEPNPAVAVYGTLHWDRWMLKGDYAETLHAMPGTFNPNPPLDIYPAHRIASFDLGAKYSLSKGATPIDLSLDFSALVAGPKGSPWHRQDQWVGGVAAYPLPSVKLFFETVLVKGYLPFNFLTGGAPGEDLGTTESSTHKTSKVLVIGVNAAL
ncbi:MAG: hypothetical protein RLZZ136_67 [Pseudomonadota bacterium]